MLLRVSLRLAFGVFRWLAADLNRWELASAQAETVLFCDRPKTRCVAGGGAGQYLPRSMWCRPAVPEEV